MAEAGGASEAQIRRAGRWNSEKMEGCYLTTLPKKAYRALAGFHPKGGGFFLKRATVDVPEELLAEVFPEAARFDQSLIDDVAGDGFLKLILHLRTVLLQDAAVLVAEVSSHAVWTDPIFSSDLFKGYAAAVREAVATGQEAVIESVQAALPVMSSVVQSGLSHVGDRILQVEKRLAGLDEKISLMMDRGFKIVLNVDPCEPATTTTPQASAVSNVTTPWTSLSACTSSIAGPDVPSYKLIRDLNSIRDVWREYVVGINGGPSVKALEAKYGPAWRTIDRDRKFFSRRKVYYDAIERLSTELGEPATTVADRLEVLRVRLKMSLDAFMKKMKREGAMAVFKHS